VVVAVRTAKMGKMSRGVVLQTQTKSSGALLQAHIRGSDVVPLEEVDNIGHDRGESGGGNKWREKMVGGLARRIRHDATVERTAMR
jgi:hypothetical protein